MFRIKICGITSRADAELAVSAGADAIGLNFYHASPRCIDVPTASEIVRTLPSGVASVGVFVNSSADEIARVVEQTGLTFVQLHGDESSDMVSTLASLRVIKAFRCRDDRYDSIVPFVDRCQANNRPLAAVLIDAFVPGQFGGTGGLANWDLTRRLRDNLASMPIILAGGLHAANVALAVEAARPDAVDTASGVESRPGVKDALQTIAFVNAAKAALARLVPRASA